MGLSIVDPLTKYRERRKDLTERMAADIVKYESWRTEQDAIRSLFGRGYAMADIVMLVDEARTLAFQEVVAKEMGQS